MTAHILSDCVYMLCRSQGVIVFMYFIGGSSVFESVPSDGQRYNLIH
jgi:hypothetical protein